MSSIAIRVKQLETRLTDATELAPHSEAWFAYWSDTLDRYLAGEDPAHPGRLPLENSRSTNRACRSRIGGHSMKALGARLRRLEDRLVPPDYINHPRHIMRLIVSGCGLPDRIGPGAWCKRSLCQDGTLMELVYIDGYDEFISEDEIDQFVNSFPITILGVGASTG